MWECTDSSWFGTCFVCDLGGTGGRVYSCVVEGFRQWHSSTSQASLAPAGAHSFRFLGRKHWLGWWLKWLRGGTDKGIARGMDMLAPGSVGSGWALEQSPVTLMHGHELYYALAAAYQIHLSSHLIIYLFVSTICPKSSRVKTKQNTETNKKPKLTRFKNEVDLEYFTEWVRVPVKSLWQLAEV